MLELNKIYCGDCLEVMKQIPDKSIDLVLTDPPYWYISVDKKIWLNYKTEDEFLSWYITFLGISYDKLKKWWIICIQCNERLNYKIRNLLDCVFGEDSFINELVRLYWAWNSTNKKPFAQKHDTIYIYWKWKEVKFNIIKEDWVRLKSWLKIKSIADKSWYLSCDEENRVLTPYQKPVKLYSVLLKSLSNKWDTILDPFLWSWTTAVACKELGRNFIGIEKEQKYVDIANKRLETTTISLF